MAAREPWEVLGVDQSELVMALAAVSQMLPSVSQRPQALGADKELGEIG